MQGFKIGFIAGLLVGALALFGVFGFDRLKQGDDYLIRESQLAQVESANNQVMFEIEESPGSEVQPPLPVENNTTDNSTITPDPEPTVPAESEEPDTSKITPKDQELITALERLITDKVVMDLKSRGTRVGTVQEFLNIYENKNLRVDNDYGPGTKERVRNFQRASGLTADGQTGVSTYQKMIDWLKAN